MFLGALLDLGLPRRDLEADLAGLGLDFRLKVRRVKRRGLAGRYVAVEAPGGSRRHAHGREFRQIVALLRRARLDSSVRRRALEIFELLGRAEARVHGVSLDRVHFHEVGAVDALVDVTGAAIGLERLEVAVVTASPVALGSGGRIETQHGRLPVPAPATLELLRGLPTVPAHVEWETVTPTGAAILRAVAETFGPLPAMTVEAIGHGAGDDREGPVPNLLRAVLGSLQHLQMKKNRPGYLVRALARPSERLAVARALFTESTAIGVRVSESDRIVLEREQRRVDTPYGRIRVKRVWDPEGRVWVSAEYDDCKQAARRSGAPLREVVRVAEEAGRALD
jgi:uncharacterized protein (DUF111 family)